MGVRLYVGNLPYSATDDDVQAHFEQAGAVDAVHLIREQATGKFRGFGFVEMADDAGKDAAIERFHDADFQGRKLVVNVARPKAKQDRPRHHGGDDGHRRDYRDDRREHRRESRW